MVARAVPPPSLGRGPIPAQLVDFSAGYSWSLGSHWMDNRLQIVVHYVQIARIL
jgi:hypothetical protein